MKAPYGIVEIARQQILGPEHMGSKAKFWCQLESSERGRQARWLFKHPQEHTGQHWAERIAAELAARLGIPHAPVRLATYEGARGSICKSFVRQTPRCSTATSCCRSSPQDTIARRSMANRITI